MRKILLTVVIFTLLASTAYAKAPIFIWRSPYLGEMTMPNAQCRHEATFCAFVAYERYEVRLVYGWSSGVIGVGEAHVQAQAKVGESWVWLTMMGRECYFGSQDVFDNRFGENQPYKVEQYFTLQTWVVNMYLWADQERLDWMINQEEGKK
jgi:hypothetical protein